MEKELVKKTDVAPSLLIELDGTDELVARNYRYNSVTRQIKNRVDEIFESYLEIGQLLDQVKKEKLYLANDYKNINEYAMKEFELSSSTVKRLIAIYNRFCDDEAQLLEEYKGFSYSNLAELLSVDDKDIKSFVPTMSVKAVRSKKLELEVNEKLEALYATTSGLSKIINLILFHDSFGHVDNITHSVAKDKFEAVSENYWENGAYSIIVNFFLVMNTKKQEFYLKISLNNKTMELKANYPWFSEKFETADELSLVIEKVAPLLLKQLEPSDKEETTKKEKKKYFNFSGLGSDEPSDSLLKIIGGKLAQNPKLSDYFISSKFIYDEMKVYAKPEEDKKENPPILILHNLDDFSISSIEDCHTKVREKIFPDFDEYMTSNLEKNIEKFFSNVGSKNNVNQKQE